MDFSIFSKIEFHKLICEYIRFPTSKEQEGTDAMHTNCDYSAIYISIITKNTMIPSSESPIANSIIFTIGKGTETIIKCVEELSDLIIGIDLGTILKDFSGFWRKLTCDPQMRWLGPEKGVVHMAVGGIINAIWDLWAKLEKKPLWKLLVDMEPEQLISCLDFRYVTDVLTPEEALKFLIDLKSTRNARESHILKQGYPAYTTAVGWAGYSDEKVKEMLIKSKKEGFKAFKVKVGCGIDKDLKRLTFIRELIGKDDILMTDANQVWSVSEAISSMKKLAHLNILWIEEPTAPDDAFGHSEISKHLNQIGIRIATGEHAHNRILHKQLNVLNGYQFVQSDPCRVGGLNELIVICLMARKFNKPVCLHAGGVGLCEMGVHMAIFDYIGISGSIEERWFEYSGALHNHFETPIHISNGCYEIPKEIGYGIKMKDESIKKFIYPDGLFWKSELKMKSYVKFRGIMAATFAPYNNDGTELNLSIIPDLAKDLIKQKVTGIFVNGTAGESVSLTMTERKLILEKWMSTNEVKTGKLHVIAHIGTNTLSESIELAQHAQSNKVNGIALMSPAYFKPKSVNELANLIVEVAKTVQETPVYYYHIPSMNGVNIEVKSTLDLASSQSGNIVGVKYTDSNFSDLGRCASAGYNVLVGADNMLLSALAAGADGAIGISYSYTGVLHVNIYEMFLKGEISICNQLQEKSRAILEKVYKYGIFACSKFLMKSLRGFECGPLRWPQSNLNEDIKESILNDIDIGKDNWSN